MKTLDLKIYLVLTCVSQCGDTNKQIVPVNLRFVV